MDKDSEISRVLKSNRAKLKETLTKGDLLEEYINNFIQVAEKKGNIEKKKRDMEKQKPKKPYVRNTCMPEVINIKLDSLKKKTEGIQREIPAKTTGVVTDWRRKRSRANCQGKRRGDSKTLFRTREKSILKVSSQPESSVVSQTSYSACEKGEFSVPRP
ncbi:hypothetical protein CCACVL1_24909 [Corchorus capsularis]|uniref:Uncharacterized protein n=1 Tax=Corchorus capsularis TaxID=210143 RepID=A0A1R3GMJ3_COCAP|nr:hypothetical protein CCACVL1_24909 [Corchorus capsularis]